MAKDNSVGWIKLYRSLLEDDLWTSDCPASYKVLWINLLLMASHKDSSVYERQIKRGQLWTSLRKLSRMCHISQKDIRKVLNMFIKDDKIYADFQRQGVLITIRNYAKFQEVVLSAESTKGSTTESTEGSTEGRHSRMIKECTKNVKERGTGPQGYPDDHWQ